MKVLYLHQYFKVDSGGTRSFEFSKHLAEKGYHVTMLCGEYSGPENIEGIKVKTTNTKYDQQFGFIKRVLSFVHFMLKGIFIGGKEKAVDIIYATSTPLTIGLPALVISKIKRIPYVFEVRDVWPDIPIELGFIKSKIIRKFLLFFENSIYKNAKHIVVLSEGMKENLLKKGIPKEKISVITNLSMNNYYDAIVKEKKNTNKIRCIHHGTMGIVNGLDFVLDVAKKYPNESIDYYLIGEGNQKERLKKRILDENISHVHIKDRMPKDNIIKEVINADIGIMTVENYKILEDNSANKFFDYLAAGLPVLINYQGWQKRVLEKNGAGKSFDFEDKKGFYEFIRKLKDENIRGEYSENAKKLAIENYDSRLLSSKFELVLKQALNKE